MHKVPWIRRTIDFLAALLIPMKLDSVGLPVWRSLDSGVSLMATPPICALAGLILGG